MEANDTDEGGPDDGD